MGRWRRPKANRKSIRPAHENLHRSAELKKQYAASRLVAGLMNGGPTTKLLSRETSGREVARDHEIRAVDGAQFTEGSIGGTSRNHLASYKLLR